MNKQWIFVILIIVIILFYYYRRGETLCDYKPIEAKDAVLGSGSPDRLPLPNLPNRDGMFYPAGVFSTSGIGRSFS